MELLKKYLNAGFVDPKIGKVVRHNSGTPQGGILSPILSNIVLNQLDEYIQNFSSTFEKGKRRKMNPEYKRLLSKRSLSRSVLERKNLLKQMRRMRSVDMTDKNFRRISFIRYADDFIVLVTGSLRDTKYIRDNIKDVLKTKCGLEMNQEKSVITNIAKEK